MEEKQDKRKRAAALTYSPADGGAPILSAYGEGHLAQRIIDTARESDVPVQRDDGLAGMLAKMSVGDEIPPQLYEVVAKLLLFLSDADKKYSYNETIKRRYGS